MEIFIDFTLLPMYDGENGHPFSGEFFPEISMEANYGKQFPRHRRDNLSRPDSGCDALLPGHRAGFDRNNLITVAGRRLSTAIRRW